MLKYNYVTVFIIGQFANEKSEKKIKWSCWRRFLNCFDAIFASLRNEKCFYKVYKEMNRKSNKNIQNYSGTHQNKYLTVMYFALFFYLDWMNPLVFCNSNLYRLFYCIHLRIIRQSNFDCWLVSIFHILWKWILKYYSS